MNNNIPTFDGKIGLALSGGGFRASIFHLGVMKEVSVISAVSGGSIIAAYYVIEMEKQLETRKAHISQNPNDLDAIRLEICEIITKKFFDALDYNLRTRIIFSPFYRPYFAFKSLFPGYSRSDLLQRDYDKFFYNYAKLDLLPAPRPLSDTSHNKSPLVILNATSLTTGKRVAYQREHVQFSKSK